MDGSRDIWSIVHEGENWILKYRTKVSRTTIYKDIDITSIMPDLYDVMMKNEVIVIRFSNDQESNVGYCDYYYDMNGKKKTDAWLTCNFVIKIGYRSRVEYAWGNQWSNEEWLDVYKFAEKVHIKPKHYEDPWTTDQKAQQRQQWKYANKFRR